MDRENKSTVDTLLGFTRKIGALVACAWCVAPSNPITLGSVALWTSSITEQVRRIFYSTLVHEPNWPFGSVRFLRNSSYSLDDDSLCWGWFQWQLDVSPQSFPMVNSSISRSTMVGLVVWRAQCYQRLDFAWYYSTSGDDICSQYHSLSLVLSMWQVLPLFN